MKTRLFILILLEVFTVSCSPLRKIQKSETHQTHIDDSLLTELVRQEVTRSLLNIKQTEIEFFHPILELPDSIPQSVPPAVPVRQAVKKITVTEVSSSKDSKTVTDSTTNVTHHEDTHTENDTTAKEKPSEALSWGRYTAVILALILLLIIIIKIRL